MQTVAQTMAPPGRAKRRLTGLVAAVVIQVAFLAALITGLDIKVWPKPNIGSIPIKFVATKKVDYPPPQPIPWEQPVRRDMPTPPVFDIGEEGDTIHPPPPIQGYRPGPADHGPLGVAGTHTTPPYPPLAIRLGQQGTVTLRVAVSPQGVVTGVSIMRSSGYELLDQAAVAWVASHWRYQPAIRGGVAAPSEITVGVKFDLRNAG